MIPIVHASDLHFGVRFHDEVKRPFWNLSRSIAQHDTVVANGFANRIKSLAEQRSDLNVLVTGDITRSGYGREFGSALRFLLDYSEQPKSKPQISGLGFLAKRPLIVAGNHDFFQGFRLSHPLLNYSRTVTSYFWRTPWISTVSDANSLLDVHIIGLTSLSGLNGMVSPFQFLSIGSISREELVAATNLISREKNRSAKKGRKSLLVVMSHHPPLEMANRSGTIFEQWLAAQKISVILTGHTHAKREPSELREGTSYIEFRCGSTLQRLSEADLECNANHFFLHCVELNTNNVVSWKTHNYWHKGQGWKCDSVGEGGEQPAAITIGI